MVSVHKSCTVSFLKLSGSFLSEDVCDDCYYFAVIYLPKQLCNMSDYTVSTLLNIWKKKKKRSSTWFLRNYIVSHGVRFSIDWLPVSHHCRCLVVSYPSSLTFLWSGDLLKESVALNNNRQCSCGIVWHDNMDNCHRCTVRYCGKIFVAYSCFGSSRFCCIGTGIFIWHKL